MGYAQAVKTEGGDYVVIREPERGNDPMLHNFSNPNSAHFQVAPFAKASGVKIHGKPSFEHSFYPPYSWQIISCNKCSAHLGWKFQRTNLAGEEDDSKVCDGKIELVPQTPPGDLLSLLDGKCTVSRQGWWTYQWCHQKEIRQYHAEGNGKRTHDWSLGSYDATS